ncbi:MAG: tetratricopeptide repeat protein [Ghiorsea sp.]|nr:tetratricopeptide repeat protein [Ghiorsea sp.]
MKEVLFCICTAYCLLTINLAQASVLDNIDQSNLISAIDDYRFSDYDIAIEKLETLYQKTPEHPDILQYLALSYDESSKPKKAIPFFEKWLKAKQYSTSENTRFAWLSLTQAYMKTKQAHRAITTLKRWLTANPNDIQSQITLGNILIRQKEYAEANTLWDNILKSSASHGEDKAAAWYYKAWIAYLHHDAPNTEKFAQQSLDANHDGAYASGAKHLKTHPSQHRLGFKGFASVEVFYNANVKLAPEQLYVADTDGDTGLQSTLVLGWAFSNLNLDYVLSNTTYQTLNTYDLLAHILSASWQKGNTWRFKSSYEYITLDSDNLYQGLGLGVYYTPQAWTYHYTVKFKQFNNAYGANNVNLERLGGSSHQMGATTVSSLWGYDLSLSPYIMAELTKGDATHDNSDSYYQLGTASSMLIPITKSWQTQFKLDIYSRLYAAADYNILLNSMDNTKRQDTYLKSTLSTSWKPLNTDNISLTARVSYAKMLPIMMLALFLQRQVKHILLGVLAA